MITFYSFIRSHVKEIALTLVYILIVNVLSLALPWMIKLIVDDVIVEGNTRLLNSIILSLFGVLALKGVFNYLRKMSGTMVGERIVCELREKIYWRVQKLSLQEIRSVTPAQILARITGDVNSIRRFVFNDVIDGIYSALSVFFITGIMLWIHPFMVLLVVSMMPLFVIMYFRTLQPLKDGYRSLHHENGKLIARIHETLNGLAIVRVFAAEDHERQIFQKQQSMILSVAGRTHALNAGIWAGMDLFTSLGVLIVLWVGGQQVLKHQITSGELIAFYTYSGMLFAPIIRLVAINGSYQEANEALVRVNTIVGHETETLVDARSNRNVPKLIGRVEFEDVCFGYSESEPILRGISFVVEPGETVAVVGSSGGGKTTMINLLLRFLDPTSGTIRVDGHDLLDLNIHQFRRNIAVVLQDDFLFSGSLRENISYGSFEASMNQIVGASKIAQAHNFISEFPDGYDTNVGDRGQKLSNGQRQRIAMARAILKNPSILILDEATSALDALTENKIQQTVSHYMNGRTVFIIAHRFSTIMDADKIIVLDQGRILEMGNHEALIKKSGFYSRLYYEQFKEQDQDSLMLTTG